MRRTLAVSLFALVCSTGLYAQAVPGSGAIAGLVRDMYGDGIPDTTITLTNKSIGLKRTVMTSDDGIFNAPGLVPASSYSLKVTRRGYADWELPNFDVSVGETVDFKITMFADKAPTPEEAMGALSPVQDNKTTLASLITDEQLENLPTPDRRLDSLVLLAPGVTESPKGVLVFRGLAFNNAFYLDGVDTNNRYFLNHPGIAPFVTQDASDEMQVISAAAPAEFGHGMQGYVNMVTKPATNSFHATAYDYYGKNSWNSTDFFGNGFVPTGRSNRGGLSAGLPAADKFFVSGNFERVNNSSQGLNRITNPLLTDATGNNVLSTACTTATASQCSAATAFLKAQMNVKVPMSEIATTGLLRLDYRPIDGESFTAVVAVQSNRQPNSFDNQTVAPNGGLLGSNATIKDTNRYGTLAWTHVVSGTAVNELHGYWYRDTQDATTDSSLYPSTGPIAITIAGTPVGGNPALPFNLREQRIGGTDSFTLTEASHTIRAGLDIGRNQDTMDQLYASYGQYNYDSLNSFALDYTANVKQLKNYSTFVQTLGNKLTDLSITSLHAFAEDTWRVFPRLTVNAGLRWEKERLPKPLEADPNLYLSTKIPSPNSNYSPRIGFAFMLDKRTVLRVGGGTNYQPFDGQFMRDLAAGGGLYQTNYKVFPTATSATAFPKVLANTSTLASNLVTKFYAAARFRNPYSENGSVAIERRLNRYVSLAASYVLSQGVKMWTTTDQDLPGGKTTTEAYTILTPQGTPSAYTYTTPIWTTVIGPHYQVDTEGHSHYRAAVAQLRTAPIFGLAVQATYTWSHAIDDVSAPPVFSNVPSTYAPGDYTGDKGQSNFDQRNRAVVNWNWQPVFKGTDPATRFLLNGWQVSGIGTYTSTMYTTPLVQMVGQQFSGVTPGYNTSLNGTGGWSRVPFQSVNFLPIGSHTSLDVRVSKSVPITDRFRAQLVFEGFNVTNHQNNTAVNTIEYQAVSGVLKPVTGYGAPIADYAYPFGSSARRIQVALRLHF